MVRLAVEELIERLDITMEVLKDTDTAGDNEDLEFIADQDNIFDFSDVDPFSEGNY